LCGEKSERNVKHIRYVHAHFFHSLLLYISDNHLDLKSPLYIYPKHNGRHRNRLQDSSRGATSYTATALTSRWRYVKQGRNTPHGQVFILIFIFFLHTCHTSHSVFCEYFCLILSKITTGRYHPKKSLHSRR